MLKLITPLLNLFALFILGVFISFPIALMCDALLLVANALSDRLEVGIRFDDSDGDLCISKGNQRLKKL